MKRGALSLLLLVLALGICPKARAETRVKMRGDAFIMANYFQNHNYTGWNKTGTKTEDTFEIWERFRLRADFEANKSVYFRLGLRIINTWGQGTFTAANPAAEVLVDVAYLQFKWPDTDIEITAGYQALELPQNAIFNSSVIYSEPGGRPDRARAGASRHPFRPGRFGGVFRLQPDLRQQHHPGSDEFDAYFLALPVTLEGFQGHALGMTAWPAATPPTPTRTPPTCPRSATVSTTPCSPPPASPHEHRQRHGALEEFPEPYFWAGGCLEVAALDPVRLLRRTSFTARAP